MIKSIITFSAHNRLLMLMCVGVFTLWGYWCLQHIPLDAIPDLSDTQVIVVSKWDRSPDVIEDQVTYPIITALLGSPRIKAIRGFSDFGYSYVYIIYEDDTDVYWARSRTLEALAKIQPSLPQGVRTELGPDATGVGWVFQYALVDKTGTRSLHELRSLQDWDIRYQLQGLAGVAEVATVGGFVKQYQVNIDPNKLLAFNIPLMKIIEAIRKSNNDVGGRLVEFNGIEYMVRGRGYIKSLDDLETIAIGADPRTGAHIMLRQVAKIEIGPDIRRGAADWNGEGDTVFGVVIMRNGENALRVIDRVKERLEKIKKNLPTGIEIVTAYDRSDLIKKAIRTLQHTLMDEMIIVSLVVLIFLWHLPSAIVPIITIPVSVLISFIPFYYMGLTANIMSLSGIAISIGVLVDGAIVEVENAYKKLELWIAGGRKGDFHEVRLEALTEVGPSVFFSLLVIAVSFIPVFSLVDMEGRLFKPLAVSKNMAMAMAALLAITLDPALRMMFTRMEPFKFRPRFLQKIANMTLVGTYYPEERHPVSRVLFRLYEPVCLFVLKHRKTTLAMAGVLLLSVIPVYMQLGSEFMPPLNEGAILYMPNTNPGVSITEATRLLNLQDRILRTFPEVETVAGKIGRADTATDPAPLTMVETVVVLKSREEWRKVKRWYAEWPEFLHPLFRRIWDDRISWDDLIGEMNKKLDLVGWTNSWTMPIKNRIDMLSTGIRTPVGIKILGPDLKVIQKLGTELEQLVKSIPGTRNAYAERVADGYFIDFELRRHDLARYDLTVDDANEIIMSAIGGEPITVTIEGRERYSVNLRYAREFRSDIDTLSRVLVPLASGAQIPLSLIADIRITSGPAMIRDENGKLAGYVMVDMDDAQDIGGYVSHAQKVVAENFKLPEGYELHWSGQYENMKRVREKLSLIIPITLFGIFLLLYANTRSFTKTSIVMLAVPFSLVGAVWLIYLLGYHVSVAVWVGMIALMGLDAETGVFMLLFLDLSYDEAVRAGKMNSREDLREAIIHGAVKRIRPKMMTVCAAFIGLLPIMFSLETGSDMMKRIAAPMVGGLVTSFVLELMIYPVIYAIWRERSLPSRLATK